MKTGLNRFSAVLAVAAAATFVAGCASTPDPQATLRYGERVRVFACDATPRPFNPNLGVYYDDAPLQNRPRHAIAELHLIGRLNDQVAVRNTLIWKAKSLGADGVYMKTPTFLGWVGIRSGPSRDQYDFRAEAFVWANHITPGTPATASTNTVPTTYGQ